MNRPNLTLLSKEIYEANKLKGWHDKEYSNEHYLCLVISELMEAVEADRKGRRADLKQFEIVNGNVNYVHSNSGYKIIYESHIKGSIEEELADAIIRLLDLAGVRGIDLHPFYSDKEKEKLFEVANINYKNSTFTEVILATISVFFNAPIIERQIKQCVLSIEWICKHLSIDLWLHVDLKLKYNLTL